MSLGRTVWRWLLVLGGAGVLVALAWRLGPGPFVAGIAMVDAHALLVATGITLFTTVCSAWRWRLVARGIGIDLPLRSAVAAYYRSQFLNSVLPGGVLGDVHRGVDHGLDSGDVGRGLRAVAWERIGGQVVQVAVAVAVLAVLPSPVPSWMPLAAATVLAAAALAVMLVRVPAGGTSFWARAIRTSETDLRSGLLGRGTWPGVVLTSFAAMAGHVAILLIAARAAGVTESALLMLPLAVLVLLAMSIPMSIAGWGPREGAAAWAFSAAGLGASQGVTVAVAYGVLAFVACLPGAAVMILGWLRHRLGKVQAVVSEGRPADG